MPIVLGIVAIIALIGAGIFFLTPEQAAEVTTPLEEEAARTNEDDQTTVEIETESDATTDIQAQTEADLETNLGSQTYSSEVSYLTPARTTHNMTVNLTLSAEGTIVDSNIIYDDGGGFSNANQERFDAAYKSEVIGQNISTINLSRVAGASLTTEAFNEAVAEIEAKQA
jgi:hypothetical protein